MIPTPEDAPFPVQTSLYGASKAPARDSSPAYAEGFGLDRHRLPLRVDPRRALHARPRLRLLSTQLVVDPSQLRVLGDGKQRKSLPRRQRLPGRDRHGARPRDDAFEIFNLGVDEYCTAERLDRMDHRAASASARARVHRRRPRLDRRQPVHLPRHRARSGRPGWKPAVTIREAVRTDRRLPASTTRRSSAARRDNLDDSPALRFPERPRSEPVT